MTKVLWLVLLLGLAAAEVVAGPLLISEVLYDADGTDQGRCFVELFGPGDMSLAGYVLEGVNGVGGTITHSLSLDGITIPSDGFLVLADLDGGGGTSVAEADFGFANLDLQNGPDSVRLMFGATVVDALGYGVFGPGLVFAGEGSPAPDAAAGSSLARKVTGLDTNDNSLDFFVDATPTPGAPNLPPVAVPTPEPSGLVLMGGGLLALCGYLRRYRRKQKTVPADVAT